MSQTPTTDLSLTEAAQALGVATKTMSRRLAAGTYPGAYRSGNKQEWQIPAADLGVEVAELVHDSTDNLPVPHIPDTQERTYSPDGGVGTITELAKLLGATRAEAREIARMPDSRFRLLESGRVYRLPGGSS